MRENPLVIGEFLTRKARLNPLIVPLFRCVSTGRKCDGYENPKSKSSSTTENTPPPLEPFPLIRISGTPTERRALHVFFSQTVPNITGFFEPIFWTRNVLHLVQTEPAIRYAAQALGAMYAQGTEPDIKAVSRMTDFALTSYNKAIRALFVGDPSANERKLIILVTCVLFVCLEFMRGETAAAIRHINSGLKLLSEWLFSGNTDKSDASPISSIISDPDIFDLTSMFTRLRLQAEFSMHALPFSWCHVYRPMRLQNEEILLFCSLTEARDELFAIANECVSSILPATEAKYVQQVDANMIVRRIRLEKKLRTWRRTFESSIAIKKSTSTTQNAVAANILLILCISLTVWAAVCLDVEEVKLDNYREEFEDVITLAKAVIDTGTGGDFQFEIGIIPPLHMIGSKCRFPDLRQEIIDILSSKHWREGIFDSYASSRFIELTRRIEDEGVDPDTGLPTETARVHFADQSNVIGKSPGNYDDRKVVFYLKPHGPYGPWFAREESLNESVWVGRVVNAQHLTQTQPFISAS